MKTNYHTHNQMCRHATGTVEDYVKEAIKANYDILGISDHSYMKRKYFNRCSLDELKNYYKEIDDCQKKYEGQIKIYKGLEVDYFEEDIELFEMFKKDVDYMILAVHFLTSKSNFSTFSVPSLCGDQQLLEYEKLMVSGIKSGYFKFIAHPDMYMKDLKFLSKSHISVAHEICKMAKEYNIPLEFNANGLRKAGFKQIDICTTYPRKEFFSIAKQYDCSVLVGSDCHRPEFLDDLYMHKARKLAIEWGLNVIEKLDI